MAPTKLAIIKFLRFAQTFADEFDLELNPLKWQLQLVVVGPNGPVQESTCISLNGELILKPRVYSCSFRLRC